MSVMKRRPRRRTIALAICGLIGSAAWSQAPPAKKPPSAAPKNTAETGAPAAGAKASLMTPASLNAKAPDTYKAKFTTTKGDFVIEVTRAWAPLGVDRFYNLVKNGFFDNAHFFRVLKGFIVQFGINANPAVARVWSRAPIKDDPAKESNKRGTLTFATAGPNTRTTQMFINLGDNGALDRQGFSALGKVVEGMEVVESLYGGYGEGAPDGKGPRQDRIEAEGKAYLDKSFPQLDSIKKAVILPAGS